MTTYIVLAPPAETGSDGPDPDGFVFVKEGFCWPALYMTIPWLIWRGMWLVLAAYVLLTIVILALAGSAPPPATWSILVMFGVLVGLEANNLRRWTLERRGYHFLGAAVGDRKSEAEYRFFVGWVKAAKPQMPSTPAPVAPQPNASAPAGGGAIIGLFPTAGARS